MIASLRTALYPRLAPIANAWNERMGIDDALSGRAPRVPRALPQAGQTRPTPLLLQYGPGDYNCLHQDLYGELAFPLQVAILLSEPGKDFTGGEFVLTEQRPRMQSRGRGGAAPAGRRGGVRGASPAGQRHARHLSRQPAPRREPAALRPPPSRSA